MAIHVHAKHLIQISMTDSQVDTANSTADRNNDQEKINENHLSSEFGAKTQLIERNVKQIQIKEESKVKKIIRTREITHHTITPDDINPSVVIPPSNLSEPIETEGLNGNQRNFSTTYQDVPDQNSTSNVKIDEQYIQSNTVQNVNDNPYVTRNDFTQEVSNYQNLSSNSNGILTSLKNTDESHASLQPMRRKSNNIQSGYEELDSTFDQINQQNAGISMNPPQSYIPMTGQDLYQLQQGNYKQDNVEYIHQPSTYDTAYGTTGLVVQVPSIPTYSNNVDPTYASRVETINFQNQPMPNANSSGLVEVLWRDPEISEVISFLTNQDPVVRANAVAYLQHLTFMDDNMKKQTRLLGGIPILIDLLNRDVIEIQRNVCGALRNLSFGRKNDENKRAIRDALGIQSIVRTLVTSPDNEIRELATSALWNLSSCEEIKWSIIDGALSAIVSVIIVPYTSWFKVNVTNEGQFIAPTNQTHWSTVLKNATGMIRNVSSAGAHARKQLRDHEGLIDSILFIIKASIAKNEVDNKLVENCVCILRNLSYRCQETQDPDYDKNYNNGSQTDSMTNSTNDGLSLPTSSTNLTSSLKLPSRVSENLGCFSFARKSRSKSSLYSSRNKSKTSNNSLDQRSSALLPPHHSSNLQTNDTNTIMRTSTQLNMPEATLPRTNVSEILKPVQGADLLWQTDIVKPYLALLAGCSNYETLEAAAGAIQNLAACYWQPSIEIRAAVRKEKGLPVLVELLRMDVDPVVCVVATALRNLAIDQRNKELIGKYAMPDLVSKLPNGQADHDNTSSDDTVAAVLATLHEVISNNADFARSLYDSGGLNRLTLIVKNKPKFSTRVQRFTAQVLLDMWKFTELREIYKKGGWKESHFVARSPIISKNSTYSVGSNTIERPMASQHADRSSSMRNLRAVSSPSMIPVSIF